MKKSKQWFEVSREGMRQLYGGKGKAFVARELIANAWDEAEKKVSFKADWVAGIATVSVVDDGPGFRDLRDAYTLFGETYKRSDPRKRGRFNLGEKEVLSVCQLAVIRTTKGRIVFDAKGRRVSRTGGRLRGTEIEVFVKMPRVEFDEILESVRAYNVPPGLEFTVNGEKMPSRSSRIVKSFSATLTTEIEEDGALRRRQKSTSVALCRPQNGQAYLYEMGIPVTEIECQYDIDVQQKIPLGPDRETVPQSYLAILYAHVLNNTYATIESEQSSDHWIRTGAAQPIAKSEAVKAVVEKRWGDKVVVANPFDRNSMDDAVAAGYRVVHGSEMSKEEWENVRQAGIMPSSSDLFGHGTVTGEDVDPDENMLAVADLAKNIARACLGIDIFVSFKEWRGVVAAQFGDRVLTFNVGKLSKKFFDPPVSRKTIDLIVHEVCHHCGNHTESNYLDAITKAAGQLVMLALDEPEFFDVTKGGSSDG